MQIYYYCKSCRKENSFKSNASNRFELKEERGIQISERCKKCGTITERHINRFHAKPNKIRYLIVGLGGIILTILLLLIIPPIFIVFVFPSIMSIPFMSWKKELRSASNFNRVLIHD